MPSALRVYPDPAAVAHALAELFVTQAKEAIAERGVFGVSLAGGTTPKAAYRLLGEPPFSNALDWSKVQIFFGDERCVPPDDDRSNYKMANDAFMQPAGIPTANIHRMRGEDEPQAAAGAYRQELISVLGENPRFDLVILGMGTDGHTASLFPGSDPFADDDLLVRAVYADSQAQWRITLTPKALNAARKIVFVVEGSSKANVLSQVRESSKNPKLLPSQAIDPNDGQLIWLLDRAAAGDLGSRA